MILGYLYAAAVVGALSMVTTAYTARDEHAPWWVWALTSIVIGAGLGLVWPILGAFVVKTTHEPRPPTRRGDGETTMPYERVDAPRKESDVLSGTGPF